MTFDPLTAINGAVSNTVPLSGGAAPTGDATGAFSRVVANASSDANNVATSQASARVQESRHEATRVAAVREYQLTSLPKNPQDGVGHHSIAVISGCARPTHIPPPTLRQLRSPALDCRAAPLPRR